MTYSAFSWKKTYLQDLFGDSPHIFSTLKNGTTPTPHASLFTKIWRLQHLNFITGPIKMRSMRVVVKLNDSPALAVLHPLEMRKYPLIHDLGILSLGAKDLKKAKGTTQQERFEMNKYLLYQNQDLISNSIQYHPHPQHHSGEILSIPKTLKLLFKWATKKNLVGWVI